MDIPHVPESKEECRAIMADYSRKSKEATRAGRLTDAEHLANRRLQFSLAWLLCDALQDENHHPEDITGLRGALQGITAVLKQREAQKQ